jgi:hypothetical protein
MKTKEISFNTIQKVKANNKLSEQLNQIEKIAENIYLNDLQLQELSIKTILQYFEDLEEFTSSDFVYAMMKFAEDNQRFLSENSKNLIK